MKLRNKTAERWDFDEAFELAGLSSPFPRNITFGDVDDETEINGHFLVIEGKRDGEQLSKGQAYTMTARMRDGRTCLIVWGTPPHEVHFMQFWSAPIRGANLATFHALIAEWAKWADAEPRPVPRTSGFVSRILPGPWEETA